MISGLTAAQVDLLRRLIEEDRLYRTREAQGERQHPDDRGIEVSWTMAGVKDATARALVNAGLAEIVNIRGTQNYIYLGKYNLYDVLN